MRFEGRTGPGLSPADPARSYIPGWRFERVLRAGGFAITTELAPPDSADPEDVFKRARVFDGYVDAITRPTAAARTATCRVSPSVRC